MHACICKYRNDISINNFLLKLFLVLRTHTRTPAFIQYTHFTRSLFTPLPSPISIYEYTSMRLYKYKIHPASEIVDHSSVCRLQHQRLCFLYTAETYLRMRVCSIRVPMIKTFPAVAIVNVVCLCIFCISITS